MPVTGTLAFGTVTGTGWTPDSGTLQTAVATSDDVRATHAAPVSDYLIATNLSGTGRTLAAGSTVTQVVVTYEGRSNSLYTPGTNGATLGMFLTKDGSANFGSEVEIIVAQFADATTTFTFSGLSLTADEFNASTFGIKTRKGTNTDEAPEGDRQIDLLTMVATYTDPPMGEEEETMDLYTAGKQGGVECLLTEAVPTISSSTSIFANVPAGTIYVEFEFRSQGVHINWSGTATTAAGGGILYNAGTVYRRTMTVEKATTVKAIQAAATATGTISYFGIPKS